jgi:flagellar motility protein MotE (MotC chaperone)
MKNLLILIVMFAFFKAYAADDKKIYSQAEFDKKFKEELELAIGKIKKKSITQLTKDILEKERKLNDREGSLKQREEQIALSEKTLSKRILEFENEKQKILGCIENNQKNETIRISQLVKMISNMKPAKAAELLSVQDSQISVKIIEKIDPTKASKIFNMMDKEVSARLQKQYLNMKQ